MTDPTLFGDTPDAASPSVLGVDGLGVAATSGGGGRRGARETACAGRGAGVVATSSNGIRSGVSEGTAGSDGVRKAASPESLGNEAVGRIAGRFEALIAGLRSLEGELLEERLGMVGRCEAGLAALRSETVAELARRDGEAKAAEVVKDRLRQSRGRAKRDVKIAGQLAGLAGTSQALADGDITPQHARIIAEASEHTDVDEAELLAAAASEPTDTFGHTVRDHVNERTAEVDLQERRRRQRARRELSIKRAATSRRRRTANAPSATPLVTARRAPAVPTATTPCAVAAVARIPPSTSHSGSDRSAHSVAESVPTRSTAAPRPLRDDPAAESRRQGDRMPGVAKADTRRAR